VRPSATHTLHDLLIEARALQERLTAMKPRVFICTVAMDSPFGIGVRDSVLCRLSCSYRAIVSRVMCWPAMVKSHLRSAVPPGKLPVRRPLTR
jgi:hypothetical protein